MNRNKNWNGTEHNRAGQVVKMSNETEQVVKLKDHQGALPARIGFVVIRSPCLISNIKAKPINSTPRSSPLNPRSFICDEGKPALRNVADNSYSWKPNNKPYLFGLYLT